LQSICQARTEENSGLFKDLGEFLKTLTLSIHIRKLIGCGVPASRPLFKMTLDLTTHCG